MGGGIIGGSLSADALSCDRRGRAGDCLVDTKLEILKDDL